MLANRHSENIRRFVDAALPLSHWGQTYFDIRLMELSLIDSMFDRPISRGGHRALDIGCGIGLGSVFLADHFTAVDGTDIDEIGVAFRVQRPAPLAGQEILEKLGISKVWLNCGDTLDFLRTRPDAYDFIFSCFVLEHVPKLQPLVDQMALALRPGGRTIHIVPNTHDTIIQLLLKNLDSFWKNVGRALSVKKIQGRTDGRLTGSLFTPITHSEFIDDYRDQFEVNSLEHYILPLLNSGLRVLDIKPIREHAFGILAEKPAIR